MRCIVHLGSNNCSLAVKSPISDTVKSQWRIGSKQPGVGSKAAEPWAPGRAPDVARAAGSGRASGGEFVFVLFIITFDL